MTNRTERMMRDLADRGAAISAFLVLVDGKKQILGYDHNGLVNFISDKVDMIQMYEKNRDGTMNSMCSIGILSTAKSEPEPEPEDEKKMLQKNLLD